MRTFGIDSASHEGHLVCIDGDCVVAIQSIQRVTDAEMIPLIDALLKDAGWTPQSLQQIACNLGPGGFTSVRGGVAFANALADQLAVPIAGYHGSTLALVRCPGESIKPIWLHSTRRDQLFAQGGMWQEPTLVDLDHVLAGVSAGMTVVGDLLPEHHDLLLARGVSRAGLRPLAEVLPLFLANLRYERCALVPWYGRGI